MQEQLNAIAHSFGDRVCLHCGNDTNLYQDTFNGYSCFVCGTYWVELRSLHARHVYNGEVHNKYCYMERRVER